MIYIYIKKNDIYVFKILLCTINLKYATFENI